MMKRWMEVKVQLQEFPSISLKQTLIGLMELQKGADCADLKRLKIQPRIYLRQQGIVFRGHHKKKSKKQHLLCFRWNSQRG